MNYTSPTISQGMGIVATILHQAGHSVKAIDNNSFYKHYYDRQLLKIIKEYEPDVVAFNVTTINALTTYQFLKKIKRSLPEMLIVGGGIHMKTGFEEALQNGFDIVVNHEGEKVVVPLFKHLEIKTKSDFKADLDNIPGVSFIKDDGTIHIPSSYPVVNNLDEVPFVDYDLFNLSDYLKNNNEPGLMLLNGQRGCPFTCTFCSNQDQRSDNRVATADYMFQNIKHYYNKYGLRYFSIVDNNFLVPKSRTIEFCNKMIESGLNRKVSLVCQTKIETVTDEGLVSLLKEAGFFRILFGIERLDPYSLEMIKKKTKIEKIQSVFSMLQRHNIDINVNVLLGFPFETVELLEREKHEFLKLLKYVKTTSVGILQPTPGTIYYDNYQKAYKWYLNPKFNRLLRAYFSQVLDLSMVDMIKFNFFDLADDVLDEMKGFYLEFKKMNHGNYIQKKTMFVLFVLKFDLFLARISKLAFSISPNLEFWIFRKITFLRYYFGMRFFGKQISKNIAD